MAAASTADDNLVPPRRYRVIGAVPTDADARLFEADDTRDGRRVFLRVHDAITSTVVARALELAPRFTAPGVLPPLDGGAAGPGYLVYPRLPGRSLEAILQFQGPLEPEVAARIVCDAAEVVQAAHREGVLHLGLDPAWIHLAEEDDAVAIQVSGFGLPAPTVRPEGPLPLYLAPEQVEPGAPVDGRCDVWALGAILYAALSGAPPLASYKGTSQLTAALLHSLVPPLLDVAPWIVPRLAALVHGLLLRDPVARCPDPGELRRMLEPFAASAISAADLARVPKPPDDVGASPAIVLPRRWSDLDAGLPERVPLDPREGTTFDGYGLTRLIARSRIAGVYEASSSRGPVALKIIYTGGETTHELARHWRFGREARAMQAIQSPHVVKVHDIAHEERSGQPYLVMELVRGRDLKKVLDQVGALEPRVVAALFAQACHGLGAAHEKGIIHRDLKPANLLLDEQGEHVVVKVCDFGIAKLLQDFDDAAGASLTQGGSVLGTPLYMSPEQVRDPRRVDVRSDLWSLCAALYETLAGRPPWEERSVQNLLAAIAARDVVPLDELAPWLPPGWFSVVARGLRRDPDQRYQSAPELAAALVPLANGQMSVARAELAPNPAAPAIARRSSSATVSPLGPPPPELETKIGRRGALQRLDPGSDESRERLAREAQLTARLSHPGIAKVYWAGASPSGQPTYAVRRVAGRALDEAARDRPFAERLALVPRVLAAVEAVAHAHAHRIVHRDLTPARIVLGDAGETVVTGWGQASADADERVDVQALGAILRGLLAGGSVPRPLARVIARRYPSARALADHLRAALADSPRRRRLMPVLAGAGAVLALALLARSRLASHAGAPAVLSEGGMQRLTFRRGLITNARFTSQGRAVYTARFDGQPGRVYVADSQDAEPRLLTASGFYLAAVSSDDRIAVLHDAQPGDGWSLALTSLAGEPPRDVAQHVQLADFTPAGELVVALRENFRFTIEWPIGHPVYHSEFELSGLRVSPDGRRLAFIEHPLVRDSGGRVIILSASKERTESPFWKGTGRNLAWRPDGGEVWFSAFGEDRFRGLAALSVGGESRRVTTVSRHLTLIDLGPGHALALDEEPAVTTYARSGSTGPPRDISVHNQSHVTDVSDDGRTLLIAEGGGPGEPTDFETYLRPTDGGAAVHIGTGWPARLSHDGRWVLTFALDGSAYRVLLVPTGPGTALELEHGPITDYNPFAGDFFPDDGRVLLVGKVGDRDWRVWVQDARGGPPRPLTEEGWRIATFARCITPDGDHLIVVGPDGRYALRTLSTGAAHPIRGLPKGPYFAGFSTDGRSLFVGLRTPNLLWLEELDLATGAPRTYQAIRHDDWMWNGPFVTPDGQTVAYSLFRPNDTLYDVPIVAP